VTARSVTDRLTDRIANALQAHFHGGLYGTFGALGHDDVASACTACWMAASVAAREVAR